MQDQEQASELTPRDVAVVRSIECQSVSGKSTITYEFGIEGLSGQLMFRIKSNSGGGMFGKDWVSVQGVIQVLKDEANREEIKAIAFRQIFLGKSINTQSFLLAALRNEEVVVPHSVKPRGYQVCDVGAFEERMKALMDGVITGPTQHHSVKERASKRPVLKLKKKSTEAQTN